MKKKYMTTILSHWNLFLKFVQLPFLKCAKYVSPSVLWSKPTPRQKHNLLAWPSRQGIITCWKLFQFLCNIDTILQHIEIVINIKYVSCWNCSYLEISFFWYSNCIKLNSDLIIKPYGRARKQTNNLYSGTVLYIYL